MDDDIGHVIAEKLFDFAGMVSGNFEDIAVTIEREAFGEHIA